MLEGYSVVEFYYQHKLLPGKKVVISHLTDYIKLIFHALEKDKQFALFVRSTLKPIGYCEYRFSIDTWDELINIYYAFHTNKPQ